MEILTDNETGGVSTNTFVSVLLILFSLFLDFMHNILDNYNTIFQLLTLGSLALVFVNNFGVLLASIKKNFKKKKNDRHTKGK